jgi:hypothetical protein
MFHNRAKCEAYLANPELVKPIDDLRRPESERESWAPPKLKKREAQALSDASSKKKQNTEDSAAGES